MARDASRFSIPFAQTLAMAPKSKLSKSRAANGARVAQVQAARAREAAAGAAETARAHGPDDEMNVEHDGTLERNDESRPLDLD